ncbi:MAG: serine/threonine-protein kinase [Blastocatellia bacterium]|nr:serine/threonine-protein kinase [Blastocatellia bacterium]
MQRAQFRADYLAKACGADAELRDEVERMLAAHGEAGSFLNEAPDVPDSLIQSSSASVIGRQINHYHVLSQLGRGGMGEVYLAEDRKLGRRIAIKLLPAEFTRDRDRVRRFEQEAKAASALNHPNIVTIHEIGTAEIGTGSIYYIASEYIEGQMLRDRIRQGPIPLLDALEIALQIANALQVAHDQGIVHRDIKPENVMLRPDGFVKVLDFGLAKLTEMAISSAATDDDAMTIAKTMPGTIIGTPAYMSPEQARALDVDHRSDLWSLGVVLYEMVAGRRPFQGQTMTDIIVAIIERSPASLIASLSGLPPELDRIVARALTKELKDRYSSAREMAGDLKALKQRLELDRELGRMAPLAPATSESAPTAELPTQRIQLATAEFAHETIGQRGETVAPQAPPDAPPLQPARSRLLLLPALLLLVLLGVIGWYALRPKPAPPAAAPVVEREISYSLFVQRVRNGQPFREPFEATGRELFEDGWKFRFQFSSPQAGFLYLLNEGPVAKGAISYQFLFPFPSINDGSAQLNANQPLQTGWYVIGEEKGTERLLLIWAKERVPELEAVKGVVNPVDQGGIADPAQLNAVRQFLSRHVPLKPEIEAGRARKQTTVRGKSDVLIYTVELEHQ